MIRLKELLRVHWLITVVIAFFVVTNSIWIYQDQSPPLWDIAGHSYRAVELSRGQSHPSIYPPFSYSLTAVLFIFFGEHSDIPQYSLLLWLMIYGIALYSISLHFYQRPGVAAFTVSLSLCYPLLAHFTRIYDLDFPLTAIIVASLAILLHTKQFTDRTWSVLYGLCLGLALLTKWTALIFLVTPTLYLWLDYFFKNQKDRHRITKNALLALLSMLVVSGPWYFLHGLEVWRIMNAARDNVFSVPFHNLLRPANILFYAKQFVLGTAWPLAFLTTTSMIIFIRHNTRYRWLMFFSVLVPYSIMTFGFYSKESRYILPLLPLFAISAGAVLIYVQSRWRWLALGGCVALATWLWLETSWNVRIFPSSVYSALRFQNTYGYQAVTSKKPRFGFTYPTQYHTNLSTVNMLIMDDLAAHPIVRRPVYIAVVPNSIFLTAQQIMYYMALQTPRSFDYALSSRLRQGEDWEETLMQADYVITKTGDQGPKLWQPNGEIIREAEDSHGVPFDQLTLIHAATVQGIENDPVIVKIYRNK